MNIYYDNYYKQIINKMIERKGYKSFTLRKKPIRFKAKSPSIKEPEISIEQKMKKTMSTIHVSKSIKTI